MMDKIKRFRPGFLDENSQQLILGQQKTLIPDQLNQAKYLLMYRRQNQQVLFRRAIVFLKDAYHSAFEVILTMSLMN